MEPSIPIFLLVSDQVFITFFVFFSVNAADNKQRDPKMNAIKIKIDP